jgi:pimeloyl-ACP methyl ester carboxylesterase
MPSEREAVRAIARWVGRVALVAVLLLVLALLGFRAAAARREVSTRADAAPKGGRFVRAADVEMFVQEDGPATGEPVVLVHGTGAWSEIWRGTMHRLAREGYRAIALDMPPFGFTARPTLADYRDDAQGRRILGALDALGIERATLVGHSFGGRPTMQATFLAPQRVRSLVLVDAALDLQRAPGAHASPALVRAVLGTPPLRDALVASTLTNPMMTGRLLSMLVSNRDAVTPERLEMLRRPFVVTGTTARFGEWLLPFATTSESSLATDRARYATLRMPTLVLWGERDALTPVAQGRDIAGLIPSARWASLPRAGHIPAIEDPDGFDAALLAFLASTRERAVATSTASSSVSPP